MSANSILMALCAADGILSALSCSVASCCSIHTGSHHRTRCDCWNLNEDRGDARAKITSCLQPIRTRAHPGRMTMMLRCNAFRTHISQPDSNTCPCNGASGLHATVLSEALLPTMRHKSYDIRCRWQCQLAGKGAALSMMVCVETHCAYCCVATRAMTGRPCGCGSSNKVGNVAPMLVHHVSERVICRQLDALLG